MAESATFFPTLSIRFVDGIAFKPVGISWESGFVFSEVSRSFRDGDSQVVGECSSAGEMHT